MRFFSYRLKRGDDVFSFSVDDSGSGNLRYMSTPLPLCSGVFGLLYTCKAQVNTLFFMCYGYPGDLYEEYCVYPLCIGIKPLISYFQWESFGLILVKFLRSLSFCERSHIIDTGMKLLLLLVWTL